MALGRFLPYYRILLDRPRMRGLKRENGFHVQVINTLVKHTIEGRLHAVFFHPANERKCSPREGRLLKAKGVMRGVFDLTFLWSIGSGVIELKFGDNNLSESQRHFAGWCDANGVRRATCWTLEGVEVTLRTWGILD